MPRFFSIFTNFSFFNPCKYFLIGCCIWHTQEKKPWFLGLSLELVSFQVFCILEIGLDQKEMYWSVAFLTILVKVLTNEGWYLGFYLSLDGLLD